MQNLVTAGFAPVCWPSRNKREKKKRGEDKGHIKHAGKTCINTHSCTHPRIYKYKKIYMYKHIAMRSTSHIQV